MDGRPRPAVIDVVRIRNSVHRCAAFAVVAGGVSVERGQPRSAFLDLARAGTATADAVIRDAESRRG
jgi:hypothetical protein